MALPTVILPVIATHTQNEAKATPDLSWASGNGEKLTMQHLAKDHVISVCGNSGPVYIPLCKAQTELPHRSHVGQCKEQQESCLKPPSQMVRKHRSGKDRYQAV